MKTFLQHINEAPMTTTGTQGRGDDDAPSESPKPFIPDQGLPSMNNPTGSPIGHGHSKFPPSLLNPPAKPGGRTVFDMLTDPLPTFPFFKPKPTPYDQSDQEDGTIIPGRGPSKPVRIPGKPGKGLGFVHDQEGMRPQDYQNPNQTFPITTPPFYKP